jgi:MatE
MRVMLVWLVVAYCGGCRRDWQVSAFSSTFFQRLRVPTTTLNNNLRASGNPRVSLSLLSSTTTIRRTTSRLGESNSIDNNNNNDNNNDNNNNDNNSRIIIDSSGTVAASNEHQNQNNNNKKEEDDSIHDNDVRMISTLPSYRELILFTGTTILIWISEPLLSLVDTAVVGLTQTNAVLQVAALGPATTLLDSLQYLTYFLAMATTSEISKYLALGDYRKLQQTTSQLLGLAGLFGLVITALVYTMARRRVKVPPWQEWQPAIVVFERLSRRWHSWGWLPKPIVWPMSIPKPLHWQCFRQVS